MPASHYVRGLVLTTFLLSLGAIGFAQDPDRPIIAEVYTDPEPPGSTGDGPIGRDPSNQHQEFIEIYLPTAADLDPSLNKDALNLTLYEVEGDTGSSGYKLANYRIDLPMFDLDPSNGITSGAIERPSSGVVVIVWVDYVGDPPTDLRDAPNNCVALINGGITSAADYVVVAMNGRQFTGCRNLKVPDPSNPDPDDALSLINMPGEATSGIIQNGSGAYLLVNRDDTGYVKLYDDKDTGHVPPIENADPALADGNVLQLSCFLDGVAGNDDDSFDVLQQPIPENPDIDLTSVLPEGGAYSLVIPQIAEDGGHGYLRLFADVAKTTEDGIPDNEDPVNDALNAYRTISNLGPWFPTPGRVTLTTSPPELSVGDASLQVFDVLAETTARPGILAANTGGNFAMEVTATPGASSDPTSVTFGPGDTATVTTGQTAVYPSIAATVSPAATHGATVTAPVTVEGVKVNTGDPDVVNPTWATTARVRVLNPTTGLDANGLPFETTVFAAIQAVPAQGGVANELLGTDLGTFVANNLGDLAQDTLGNGAALVNATTNINNPLVIGPMVKELPGEDEECVSWLPRPGVPLPGFAQTVANSAEVVSGATTYEESISICGKTEEIVIKGIRVNVPDTKTFGGTFNPSERIHFVAPDGDVGNPRSGLANANTSRTFEIALIDTAVRPSGLLETGATDDFGIVIEVEETEPGAPVVDGDFVFLSFTGGLQGADVDTLDVPPGNNVATIILLDLDNLHDVLGIRTIEALFIVDAGLSGEVDIIEGFSLNPASGCRSDEDCDDGNICTDDACVGETCEYTNNTLPCDDGLFCTVTDVCSESICVGGGGDPCTDQLCDEVNDRCVDCLTNADCSAGTFCGEDGVCSSSCPPPRVVALGSRYFGVTPRRGPPEQAIWVTGVDPDVSCVYGYVRGVVDKGRVDQCDNPPCDPGPSNYLPPGPEGWDTVHVRGLELVGGMTYSFQADCDPADPVTFLSDPVSATLWRWGDTNCNGRVGIDDATRILDGFRGMFYTLSCTTDEECLVLPVCHNNVFCDPMFEKCLWITLPEVDITGTVGCLPEMVATIRDVTICLDAFRGFPDECLERISCP